MKFHDLPATHLSIQEVADDGHQFTGGARLLLLRLIGHHGDICCGVIIGRARRWRLTGIDNIEAVDQQQVEEHLKSCHSHTLHVYLGGLEQKNIPDYHLSVLTTILSLDMFLNLVNLTYYEPRFNNSQSNVTVFKSTISFFYKQLWIQLIPRYNRKHFHTHLQNTYKLNKLLLIMLYQT